MTKEKEILERLRDSVVNLDINGVHARAAKNAVEGANRCKTWMGLN